MSSQTRHNDMSDKINYGLLVAMLHKVDSKAAIAREVGVHRVTLDRIIGGHTPRKEGFADKLISMAREYFTESQLRKVGLTSDEDATA